MTRKTNAWDDTQQSWLRLLEHLFSALETQDSYRNNPSQHRVGAPQLSSLNHLWYKKWEMSSLCITPLDKGCFCCHQLTAVVESRENLWKRPGYNIWQIQSVWTYETTSTFCGSSLLTPFGEMDKDLGSNSSFTSSHGPEIVFISNVLLPIDEKSKVAAKVVLWPCRKTQLNETGSWAAGHKH